MSDNADTGLRPSLKEHLIRMARGQHRELRSRFNLRSVEAVLAGARDKSAEFSLLMDYAGRCAAHGQDDDRPFEAATPRAVGEDIALVVQIANDLADLFGDAPSDDLQQPIDLGAAVTFTQFVGALTSEVANHPAGPRWKGTSFFKRFETDETGTR